MTQLSFYIKQTLIIDVHVEVLLRGFFSQLFPVFLLNYVNQVLAKYLP